MAMYKSWEEGRQEARLEACSESVLTVLRVRGVAVPDAARDRILGQKDLEQLKRWHEKAIVATFDWRFDWRGDRRPELNRRREDATVKVSDAGSPARASRHTEA